MDEYPEESDRRLSPIRANGQQEDEDLDWSDGVDHVPSITAAVQGTKEKKETANGNGETHITMVSSIKTACS